MFLEKQPSNMALNRGGLDPQPRSKVPMPSPQVVDPTSAQLNTVLRWLKREHDEDLGGASGFYCNRSIIRDSFRASEMKCLVIGRIVIGFATFRLRDSYSALDILEIRPGYRQRGYGNQFAQYMINHLFSGGAPYILVECAPRSSERFWRRLGFAYKNHRVNMCENPKLELHGT